MERGEISKPLVGPLVVGAGRQPLSQYILLISPSSGHSQRKTSPSETLLKKTVSLLNSFLSTLAFNCIVPNETSPESLSMAADDYKQSLTSAKKWTKEQIKIADVPEEDAA